jgi:cell division protein FtsW
MTNKKNSPDFILLAITIFLLLIGLLILTSASTFLAEREMGRPYYFLFRQVVFGIGLGTILGFLAYKAPLKKLNKWSTIFLLINILLLCLVFVPVIGWGHGGATRWLRIGGLGFQPSELLKITLPFYLAAWLSSRWQIKNFKKTPIKSHIANPSSRQKLKLWHKVLRPAHYFRQPNKKLSFKNNNFKIANSFIPFLIILGVIFLLLILQPNISTLAIITVTAILMYFVAETPFWHNLLIAFLVIVVFFILIQVSPYRAERLQVFLNPTADPMGAGFQMKQSLIAIGSGGIFGRGLGLSQQKLGFLPEPLSDSIFAIFAEEAGFLGVLFLIFVFLAFFWRGIKISKNAKDPFLRVLSFGITCWIVLQAFVNISALIGVLPLTGIPLPFISHGGSHLVAELIGVGILLNISKSD